MNSALWKNYLTTGFGILAGLPLIVAQSGFVLDPKWAHYLYIASGIGMVGLGVVAKAFNVHSTPEQVLSGTGASGQAVPSQNGVQGITTGQSQLK